MNMSQENNAHIAVYVSPTYSVDWRPMNSINNCVIHLYKKNNKNNQEEAKKEEEWCKQIHASIKSTCNATCFQVNVFLLTMERLYNAKHLINSLATIPQ